MSEQVGISYRVVAWIGAVVLVVVVAWALVGLIVSVAPAAAGDGTTAPAGWSVRRVVAHGEQGSFSVVTDHRTGCEYLALEQYRGGVALEYVRGSCREVFVVTDEP